MKKLTTIALACLVSASTFSQLIGTPYTKDLINTSSNAAQARVKLGAVSGTDVASSNLLELNITGGAMTGPLTNNSGIYGNASGLTNVVGTNIAGAVGLQIVQQALGGGITNRPIRFLFAGDSMSDSPGGATASAAGQMETFLKNKFGWSGSGPVRTVDLSVGTSLYSTRGTSNWYGGFSIEVRASDGVANVLSSLPSSSQTLNPLTEIGVWYYKTPQGGNINLIHTATGINVTNVVSGLSATPGLAYTNFIVSDSLTDHKITFASGSGTNIFCGFKMMGTNTFGAEVYYLAKSGGTLSNMLATGLPSIGTYASNIQPDFVYYHAKDNENTNLNSFAIYSNFLSVVLNATKVANTRVIYVSTPQQQGNSAHITQNAYAYAMCAPNNWLYCDLASAFPNWTVNNANGLMLDGSHPSNPVGCIEWAKTILTLSGIVSFSGTNSLPSYGAFSGDGSGLTGITPSFTGNFTFNTGSWQFGTNTATFAAGASIGAVVAKDFIVAGYNGQYDEIHSFDVSGKTRVFSFFGTWQVRSDSIMFGNLNNSVNFLLMQNGLGTRILDTALILDPGVKMSAAKTNTPVATTGNQIANVVVGDVRIAAAGTTVTVTDSLVDANSKIFCTLGTVDTTAKSAVAVPGSGSFVITLNAAATAEVKIMYWIVN